MKRQDELHEESDGIEQMHLSFHLSGQAKKVTIQLERVWHITCLER